VQASTTWRAGIPTGMDTERHGRYSQGAGAVRTPSTFVLHTTDVPFQSPVTSCSCLGRRRAKGSGVPLEALRSRTPGTRGQLAPLGASSLLVCPRDANALRVIEIRVPPPDTATVVIEVRPLAARSSAPALPRVAQRPRGITPSTYLGRGIRRRQTQPTRPSDVGLLGLGESPRHDAVPGARASCR
jgi:hypothetical protein